MTWHLSKVALRPRIRMGMMTVKSIGVTWSDHTEASALRDALSAHGIDDVMLVAESHAAASLAQAVGRAVGYDTTALLFVDRDLAYELLWNFVRTLSRRLRATNDKMTFLATTSKF